MTKSRDNCRKVGKMMNNYLMEPLTQRGQETQVRMGRNVSYVLW